MTLRLSNYVYVRCEVSTGSWKRYQDDLTCPLRQYQMLFQMIGYSYKFDQLALQNVTPLMWALLLLVNNRPRISPRYNPLVYNDSHSCLTFENM